jgi:hypothetical protein
MSTSEHLGIPSTAADITAHAPALPFSSVYGTAKTQSYDPIVDPNLVIVGAAGAGKTHVTDLLAASAYLQGAIVIGIRARGENDGRFAQYATGLESAERLIVELHQEVRARIQSIEDARALNVDELPYEERPDRIFVIVDGLGELRLETVAPEGSDENARRTEYLTYLVSGIERIAKAADFIRMHVIYTTGDREQLSPTLREHTAVLQRGSTMPADRGAADFYDDLALYTSPDAISAIDVHVWPAFTSEQLDEMLADSNA